MNTTHLLHPKKWYLMLLFMSMFIPSWLAAQTEATLASQTKITISGTSTLHDWEMAPDQVRGKIVYSLSEAGDLAEIKQLEISMRAEALKSGKKAMDKNAYKALKAEQFDKITFKMTSVKKVSAKGEGFEVSAEGKLTIAGVTKPVVLNAQCSLNDAGELIANGKYTLNMTNYDVEPPSFMFGSVTTGEEVTIAYNARFMPN